MVSPFIVELAAQWFGPRLVSRAEIGESETARKDREYVVESA